VLRAPWKKIVCTPTDISIKTRLTPALVKQIEASATPLARYISRFAMYSPGADIMWDETGSSGVDRSDFDYEERDSLHDSRARSRSGLREYVDLD